MSIKNIIWDWNGTIVDDAWVFVDIMNGVLKKNHLPLITLKDYRQKFCFPIQDYWRGLGFRFTNKTFNQLNEVFIKEYQKKMFLPKIHKGLDVLFKNLGKQKIRQFVLSASEQGLLNKSVAHYKLGSFFNGVYGVDNLNAVGKIPLGRDLCEKHQLNVKETLLIGDTEYDKDVGEGLGCRVLLVAHGHISPGRLFKTGVVVASSVEELKRFLTFNPQQSQK